MTSLIHHHYSRYFFTTYSLSIDSFCAIFIIHHFFRQPPQGPLLCESAAAASLDHVGASSLCRSLQVIFLVLPPLALFSVAYFVNHSSWNGESLHHPHSACSSTVKVTNGRGHNTTNQLSTIGQRAQPSS